MEPLNRTKEEYKETIEKISLPQSPVGIDAQYTHAIIIEYLRDISHRLDRLEQQLNFKK